MNWIKKFVDKNFIANWAFLVFVNLIVKPAYIFGIEVPLQNQLGAENYGQYFAILNLAILLNTFLDFGVNNFNNREIAKYPNSVNNRYPIVSSLKIILGFVYALIVAITALFLDFNTNQLLILGIVIINQFLLSYLLFVRSNIGALHFFKLDSIISVLDKMLLIVVMSVALLNNLHPYNLLLTFVLSQALIYLSVILFSVFKLKKKISGFTPFKITINIASFKKLIKQSLPLASVVLLMGAYTRMDGLMLEQLLPDNGLEAGIYAAGFRLLDAGNQLAILVSVILLPRFSAHLQKKQAVKNLLNFSALLVLLGGVFATIIAFILGKNIIFFLYSEPTQYYVDIFKYLMLAFPAMCLVYVYGTLMLANNNMKALNIIAFLGVILNLTLNLILIPQHGALGAVIATIATQYLVIFSEIGFVYLSKSTE